MRFCTFLLANFIMFCVFVKPLHSIPPIQQARAAIRARLLFSESLQLVRQRAVAIDPKLKNGGLVKREVEVTVEDQERAIYAMAVLNKKLPQIANDTELLGFLDKSLGRIRQGTSLEQSNDNILGAVYFYLLAMYNVQNPEEGMSRVLMQYKGGEFWIGISKFLEPLLEERGGFGSFLKKVVFGDGRKLCFNYDPGEYWSERLEALNPGERKIPKKKKSRSHLDNQYMKCKTNFAKFFPKIKKLIRKVEEAKGRFQEAAAGRGMLFKRTHDIVVQLLVPRMRSLEAPNIKEEYKKLRQELINFRELELTGVLPSKDPDPEGEHIDPVDAGEIEDETNVEEESIGDVVASDAPAWMTELATSLEPQKLEEVIENMQQTFVVSPEREETIWDIKGGNIQFFKQSQVVHLYFHYPFAESDSWPTWRFAFILTFKALGYPVDIPQAVLEGR